MFGREMKYAVLIMDAVKNAKFDIILPLRFKCNYLPKHLEH